MLNYDFRIQEDNKGWEQTKSSTLPFPNWEGAAKHARKLNEQTGREVRVNATGSWQGSYFLP
ncbi:MAG: hypothetical protein AAFX57_16205 [Bacteroidota bacterium]